MPSRHIMVTFWSHHMVTSRFYVTVLRQASSKALQSLPALLRHFRPLLGFAGFSRHCASLRVLGTLQP